MIFLQGGPKFEVTPLCRKLQMLELINVTLIATVQQTQVYVSDT